MNQYEPLKIHAALHLPWWSLLKSGREMNLRERINSPSSSSSTGQMQLIISSSSNLPHHLLFNANSDSRHRPIIHKYLIIDRTTINCLFVVVGGLVI